MISYMLRRDIARFAIIYLMTLLGHSVAFYSISLDVNMDTGEDMTGSEFSEFFKRLQRDFCILLAQIDFDQFAAAAVPEYIWLSSILLVIHIVFCLIVLLNILIAMLGDTFGDVKENMEQEWHYVYAQIIISIENELSSDDSDQARYWTVVNNHRYLQVQEVNEKYFGTVIDFSVAETIARFDTDGDGKISAEEFQEGTRDLLKRGVKLSNSKEKLNSGDSPNTKSKPFDNDENIGVMDGPLKGRIDTEDLLNH